MKDNQKHDYIYHLAVPEQWEKFLDEDHYFPSDYEEEGFIHCSFSHQLEKVKERYYKNKSFKLLKLDVALIDENLIIEPSTKGELYPHIYSSIKKQWIIQED